MALCDPSVALPHGTDQDALIQTLEPLARAAQVFYLVTDDPLQCRVELLSGEEPAPELASELEPHGGTFGLELPSGRLAVHGWTREGVPVVAETIEAASGAQALSVWARRPFDGARHAAEMAALLGGEWTYMERVNRLGLVGCLPLALVAISLMARRWHWLWVLLPLLAVSWLPYLLLQRGRRYRAAERRATEVEQARPHYAFAVTPSDRTLPGGFLRV